MLSDQELKDLQSQMTSKKIDLSNAKDKVIKGENIFSKIGKDLSKRVENVKESFGRTVKGEQTGVEGGLQLGGQIAGGIGDVVGNIAISALNKIIPSFIKKDAKAAAEGILQTKFGKDALNAISGGINKYEDWKKSNPRAAANFESVINVADLATDVFGIGAAKSVVKEGIEEGTEQLLKKGVKELGQEVVEEVPEKIIKETAPEVVEKGVKQKLYHGTDSFSLENIKKNGFIPGSEGFVSLTDNPNVAKQFAEGKAKATGGTPEIIEIDPKSTKINRNFDPNDLESIMTQEREFIVMPEDAKNLRILDKTKLEVPEKVAKRSLAGEIATTATSQVTGLDPKTIRNIITDPDLLKKAKVANREQITANVEKVFKQKIDEVAELSKEYNPIRASKQKVDMPENAFKNILKEKYGFDFDDTGKIILTSESSPISEGDAKALEKFIKLYDNKITTPNALLNARQQLDTDFINWRADKTPLSERIALDLRNEINTVGRPQITGLEDLDKSFAPKAEYLKDLRKQITTNGEISIQKIANLDGKNRARALNIVRESMPDVDEQLKIVKTIEDIEIAKGQKVGAYTKGLLASGAVGFATGNPLLGVVTAILTYPSVAIPMIEQFGRVRKISKTAIDNLINGLKNGNIEKASEKLFIDMLEWAESGLRKEGIREVTAQ